MNVGVNIPVPQKGVSKSKRIIIGGGCVVGVQVFLPCPLSQFT